LEPLAGYLILAERLCTDGARWAGPWNFGPSDQDAMTATDVAELVLKHWGAGSWRDGSLPDAPHEANYLGLDCGKARELLCWRPALRLDEAIAMTVAWYRAARSDNADASYRTSIEQIHFYERVLAAAEGKPRVAPAVLRSGATDRR
jgi:CDP-glucose 4,6-dehydratase